MHNIHHQQDQENHADGSSGDPETLPRHDGVVEVARGSSLILHKGCVQLDVLCHGVPHVGVNVLVLPQEHLP